MENVRWTTREINRLLLTITIACVMAVLLASCETTGNGTAEVLQPRPHEHSHPESVTQEEVRKTVQEMVGPVVESLVKETGAAIDNLKKEVEERFKSAGTGALNYEVKYEFSGDSFRPLDPDKVRPEMRQEAINEADARERFFGQLASYLEDRKRKGFQLKYQVRPIERVRNFIPSITLTNAQAVSDGRTHQQHISATIENLAIEVGDPDLAVPVRRDEGGAPLPVRRLTLTHNATSGIGDVDTACKQTTTFAVQGIPEDAEAFVYDDINGIRSFKDSFPFDHECGVSVKDVLEGRGPHYHSQDDPHHAHDDLQRHPHDPHAYILVKRPDPVVAQYRSIHMISVVEEQIPVRLTTGAPACPPAGVSVNAAAAFRDALGPCL